MFSVLSGDKDSSSERKLSAFPNSREVPFFPGGAGSEAWNRVSMIAPVKKSGRARLSTDFSRIFVGKKNMANFRGKGFSSLVNVLLVSRSSIKGKVPVALHLNSGHFD